MWRVMVVLENTGSQRQIDLADLTSIDASTLSRLVTRLVRMGLVTRARSANSDREVAVELSAKGAALVARLVPIAREFEAAAITGLSPEELALVKRCLRRMFANMNDRSIALVERRERPAANERVKAASEIR
jgi:DNA-binding MarR family transcriptional regulator